jgi:hypothetical protein
VLEGFTEWLACNAMNEWGGTSYFQIMTTVEAVVKRGYPDFGSMVAAYFGGSNVKEVAEKMLSYIAKEYLPGLNDPHKEIDTLLLSMERSRKTPEGSGATLDFKERVKNAFKGVPRDSAKQKLVNHQAWFAFLEKEQVFS